jgi:hypothetical protein
MLRKMMETSYFDALQRETITFEQYNAVSVVNDCE